MQDEYLVIRVTQQTGRGPVMPYEFPSCWDFKISESWLPTVNERIPLGRPESVLAEPTISFQEGEAG